MSLQQKTKIGDHGASFNNVLHMQYHRAMYTQVTAVDKQKLHLTDELLKEWKRCIDMEEEINRAVVASLLSKRLNEKDGERDDTLSFLFGVIQHHKYSADPTERGAAEALGMIIKPYKGIQREPLEEESGHIYGLLHDLEKQPAELMALSLDATLTRLRTLNDEFAKLFLQRRQDVVASKLPTSRVARQQTDAVWDKIAGLIYASQQLSATDADRALITTLIDNLNQTFADYRTMNKQSIVPKKKDKDGKDKKPSDGDKKPGDDKDKKPSEGDKKPGDGGKKPDGGDKKPSDDGKKPDDGGGKNPGGGSAGPIPSDPLPMVPKE
ncbi:DUF6261 family protein [Hoylesella marshii]|uniref:Hemagglutinin protein HagB n=1 Tax=Hoylesella marshii DSM 16973 = JCM 13450 TaxID=862515 RepID=E0NS36_9BACT|nr:DUF6261 family protein [Hoylesella marshii]EFM01999.1 hypothetical protein HMPREF0658_0987 [Hoylesella marshii DSM 16973 = JCM 13450]